MLKNFFDKNHNCYYFNFKNKSNCVNTTIIILKVGHGRLLLYLPELLLLLK
jgi:hypothetical protein